MRKAVLLALVLAVAMPVYAEEIDDGWMSKIWTVWQDVGVGFVAELGLVPEPEQNVRRSSIESQKQDEGAPQSPSSEDPPADELAGWIDPVG